MRVTPSLFVVLLFAKTVSVSAGPRVDALCTSRHGGDPLVASTIGLIAGTNMSQRLLEEAVGLWRGCSNYQADFPAFVIGDRADRVIEVTLVRGSSGTTRCGVYSNGRIELYRSAVLDGHLYVCGPLAPNLAHELGHVLGLHDAQRSPSCRDHIMSNVTPLRLMSRTPQETECRAVGRYWLTLAEITSGRPTIARTEVEPAKESRATEAPDPFLDPSLEARSLSPDRSP